MDVVVSVHFKRLWTRDSIPSIMKRQPTEGLMSPNSSSVLLSQDHLMGTSKALQEENAMMRSERSLKKQSRINRSNKMRD